jgi:hypothetical protein
MKKVFAKSFFTLSILCLSINCVSAEDKLVLDCPQSFSLAKNASKNAKRIACNIPSDLQEKIAHAETIGMELRKHDLAAWKTSDALIEAKAFKSLPGDMQGWLSFDAGNAINVRYFAKNKDAIGVFAEAGMDLQTLQSDKGNIFPALRPASTQELAMLQARRNAINPKRLNCSDAPFNSVILPVKKNEKENSVEEIHVYLLSPWTNNNIPLGGHHLIKFKPDGKEIISEFSQTKACLNNDPNKFKNMSAFMVSHINSDTPTEMHVFMSLQYKKPIYVITPTNQMTWKIENGSIYLKDRKDAKKATEPSSTAELPKNPLL